MINCLASAEPPTLRPLHYYSKLYFVCFPTHTLQTDPSCIQPPRHTPNRLQHTTTPTPSAHYTSAVQTGQKCHRDSTPIGCTLWLLRNAVFSTAGASPCETRCVSAVPGLRFVIPLSPSFLFLLNPPLLASSPLPSRVLLCRSLVSNDPRMQHGPSQQDVQCTTISSVRVSRAREREKQGFSRCPFVLRLIHPFGPFGWPRRFDHITDS